MSRGIRRAAGAVLLAASAVAVPLAAATPSAASQAFVATADSLAFQFTEQLPGFVGGETPFNGGGPTGQAKLDSLGNTQGYAAFPDPGAVAISGPSLAFGLLKSGAAGFPPFEPPIPPPEYPLYVSSDASKPESVFDAGLFALRATSDALKSTGSAKAGFLTPGASRAATLFADSIVTQAENGSVVSSATTTAQGLVIGPLTFGQILTNATMELSADGKITRSADVRMSGFKYNDQAAELSGSGQGAAQSQQLNDQLAALLKGSGYMVRVTAPQDLGNIVVAPGVEITGPAEVPGVTSGPGTFTMRIGTASASVIGTGSPDLGTANIDTAVGPGTALPGTAVTDAAGLPSTVGGLAPAGTVPVAGVPTGVLSSAATISLLTTGDIADFYVMLAVLAAAFVVASVVTRRWSHSRGGA